MNYYREEHYTRTSPDGESESRHVIEKHGSGFLECALVILAIAIGTSMFAVTLAILERVKPSFGTRETNEIIR